MNDQLFPVPFHGDTVVLASHDNEPYVVMKPVCENIGVNWEPQFAKLKKKFRSVITMIVTTGGDGKQYEMLALHLRKFPAWVYSIEPSRVAPDLREKVVRYQDECDEVLWRYWTEGFAARPGARVLTPPQQLAAGREIRKLSQEIKRETNPALRRMLYAQLEHHCRMIGIPVPALEEIGQDAIPDHESPLLEEFWEVVDHLRQSGAALDHSRDKALIALNLPQVRAAASGERLALPDAGELRRLLRASRSPRFVAVKAVNSALNTATVKCWVFERASAEAQGA